MINENAVSTQYFAYSAISVSAMLVLFLLLFLVHGALWLTVRSDGNLHKRALAVVCRLWPLLAAAAVGFFTAAWFFTDLYENYLASPSLFLEIFTTVAFLAGTRIFTAKGEYLKAWVCSGITIAGAIFFGIIGLFPNLFPSSLDPVFSLTAHNASSSLLTLKIMLAVVIIFIPAVIAYQVWAYNLFKGKITEEDLAHNEGY